MLSHEALNCLLEEDALAFSFYNLYLVKRITMMYCVLFKNIYTI